VIGIVNNGSTWVKELMESCALLSIKYKIVDISHPSWRNSLENVDVLVWRYSLSDLSDLSHAKTKIPEIELMGIQCYPNSLLTLFYDDKIMQSMMLQREGYPHPSTKIFYSLQSVIENISTIKYPIVRKLRGGAGSRNVSIIKNKRDLERIARKELSINIFERLMIKLKYNLGINSSIKNKEGYLYLQEFIKTENDLRIVTFSDGYFSAFYRMNRKNDFRASGSNIWAQIEPHQVPLEAINLAYEISETHDFKCLAFDFLKTDKGWTLIEFSYGFVLDDIYTETLFRLVDGIVIKASPKRLGVLVLNTLI
jgi:glutathione synthase/RimK-type ligase-like ATP-grasp enzyme